MQQGEFSSAQLLMKETGLDVNSRLPDGNSLLAKVIVDGDTTTLDFLLEDPILDVNQVSNKNWTPLQLACLHATPYVVRMLLSLGAEINAQHPETHKTALHFACERGGLSSSSAEKYRTCKGKMQSPSFPEDQNEVLNLLISASECEYRYKDRDGLTPLEGLCNLFLKYGETAFKQRAFSPCARLLTDMNRTT